MPSKDGIRIMLINRYSINKLEILHYYYYYYYYYCYYYYYYYSISPLLRALLKRMFREEKIQINKICNLYSYLYYLYSMYIFLHCI